MITSSLLLSILGLLSREKCSSSVMVNLVCAYYSGRDFPFCYGYNHRFCHFVFDVWLSFVDRTSENVEITPLISTKRDRLFISLLGTKIWDLDAS